MNTVSKQLAVIVRELKIIATELWNSAAESGFCCGIRLGTPRQELMPTASSCCGVRV